VNMIWEEYDLGRIRSYNAYYTSGRIQLNR